MGDFIKIKSTADDGFEFDAYHAEAQGKRRGGVVVIQEIFGIDQYVKADVDRWAALGFEAIAPSMYDRITPDFHAEHDEAGDAMKKPLAICYEKLAGQPIASTPAQGLGSANDE